MATNEAEQTKSSDFNRCYRAERSRTEAGSPVLKIIPNNPRGVYADERQIAACIYDLAGALERKSYDAGEYWAVSTYPGDGRIVVELSKNQESSEAEKLIGQVLAELNFR